MKYNKMSKDQFRDVMHQLKSRSKFWDLLLDLGIISWKTWEMWMSRMESEMTMVVIKRGEKD